MSSSASESDVNEDVVDPSAATRSTKRRLLGQHGSEVGQISERSNPVMSSNLGTAVTSTNSSTYPLSFGGCIGDAGSLLCGGGQESWTEADAITSTSSRGIVSTASTNSSCITALRPGDDSYKTLPHPFALYRSSKKHRRDKADGKAALHDMTDPLLAAELASLSIQDREKLYDEIHGCAVQQHPQDNGRDQDFIDAKLQEMDDEINKNRNKADYNMAHFLAPSLVKDRKFRLMFLRCDLFDAKKAAKRMITFYEYKAIVWGNDKVRY